MSVYEILTLLAIFLGPISAVIVTRRVDALRERHSRRMDIFRALMKTRRTGIHPDQVAALNLVEIEFFGDGDVVSAWKKLFTHYSTPHGSNADEIVSDSMTEEEKSSRIRRKEDRIFSDRQKLYTALLHKIANSLKFRIEQLEILDGGYHPQGLVDIELEQAAIRRYFVDLASARRAVPVAIIYDGSNKPTE